MNPKLSIITPSFNSARFIEETIQSVKEQTYSPIEHLVMDGGSTDGTVDILRHYKDTYNLRWWSEPDRGQSHAFNKGIHAATGEWLYFLNSDDYLLDADSIKRVAEYICCHPGFSIYMGKIWVVDAGRRILDKCDVPFAHSVYSHDILINQDAMVIHQGTFYLRRVFERAGGYSERLRYHMDYEFHLRASKYFDIKSMERQVAALRMYIGNKTLNGDYRHALELFWSRRTNGGKLLHLHNLLFLRIFVASHPLLRPLYNYLKKVSFIRNIARRTGSDRLGLGR
jgi:glycosyltransferase involved in cell wall biosynthesis